MIGIYRITNLIDGKSYIGQSIDIRRRFCDHRCFAHETNRHLKFALEKYGKDNFKYEVLEECSAEMLDERERFYIKTLSPEYNVTNGGQGRGRHLPDEVKEVLRRHGKAQWARKTEAEKAETLSRLLCGGKVGHPVSEEAREKLRRANLGKKQSRETIEKRKQTILRKKANGYVQTNGEHRKKIICLDTGIRYNSVKEAGEALGIRPTNISAVLKGKQKTTHGYRFEYLKV